MHSEFILWLFLNKITCMLFALISEVTVFKFYFITIQCESTTAVLLTYKYLIGV